MKLSTKPISSPGRTEKFPPPLMRFLRSNVGSRSRGRSRSSPMFVLRKKSAAIETQEPSSPKVTCMGQVRVRRSKQSGTGAGGPGRTRTPKRRRCKWIRNALFCRHLNRKLKPRSFRPAWPKWVLFCHSVCKRKGKISEEKSTVDPKFGIKSENFGDEDDDEEGEAKVFVSASVSPPKNALLLTRCRSAPYRSSSLAGRFWGSPLASEETEQEQRKTELENTGDESPTSGRNSVSKDSYQETRMDPETQKNLGFGKEGEDSNAIKESIVTSAIITDFKKREDFEFVRPLILTRCKSEPARTAAEKLDPEFNLWKKRRLDFT